MLLLYRKLLQSAQYKGDHVRITCLQYSPRGDYLAVGFETGHVEVLDAVTLHVEGSISGEKETEACFDYSNDSVKRMVFSHDTSYLACAVSFKIYVFPVIVQKVIQSLYLILNIIPSAWDGQLFLMAGQQDVTLFASELKYSLLHSNLLNMFMFTFAFVFTRMRTG